jgi:hypothetical protein
VLRDVTNAVTEFMVSPAFCVTECTAKTVRHVTPESMCDVISVVARVHGQARNTREASYWIAHMLAVASSQQHTNHELCHHTDNVTHAGYGL